MSNKKYIFLNRIKKYIRRIQINIYYLLINLADKLEASVYFTIIKILPIKISSELLIIWTNILSERNFKLIKRRKYLTDYIVIENSISMINLTITFVLYFVTFLILDNNSIIDIGNYHYYIITLFYLLYSIDWLVMKWRVNSGIYGRNALELVEIVEYLAKNNNNDGEGGGGGGKYHHPLRTPVDPISASPDREDFDQEAPINA